MIATGTENPTRVLLVVTLVLTWVTSASQPGITYWPDHIGDFGPP